MTLIADNPHYLPRRPSRTREWEPGRMVRAPERVRTHCATNRPASRSDGLIYEKRLSAPGMVRRIYRKRGQLQIILYNSMGVSSLMRFHVGPEIDLLVKAIERSHHQTLFEWAS